MKTVIFASENDAGWAQIAATLFNVMADPGKARAIAAGTNAATGYHPLVVSALKEMEVPEELYKSAKTQTLTADLAKSAAWLVTPAGSKVGTGITGPEKLEWPPMDDPATKASFKEVEPIRDATAALVSGFVEEKGWARSA